MSKEKEFFGRPIDRSKAEELMFSGSVECANCGETEWELIVYRPEGYGGNEKVGMFCMNCDRFVEVIPKGSLDPEYIMLVDLQDRMKKLEEKLMEIYENER